MIPKYLRFQAFESYVREQTIDFDRLSECGLFLINGETGAGKTAILDAMTYALYGETSGGTRGDVRSLHPMAAGLPTEVEFIFSLRGMEYKFTRSIRIRERAGKQTVITEQNALFRDGKSFVPFEANPTRTKVAAKAAELLGLTLEQFRQVILLPQGQFEKFLTSESAEKEEILSTLFGTERFSRISETLYAQSRRRLGELNTQKELLGALITNEGFSDFEALNTFLQEAAQQIQEEQRVLYTEREVLERRKAELSAAEKLFSLFDELESAQKEHALLDTQSLQMDASSTRLEKAQTFLKIEGIYREYEKGQKELKAREDQAVSSKSKLGIGQMRLAEAEKSFQSVPSLEKKTELLLQEKLWLEPLVSVYSEIQKARTSAENMQKSYETALEKLNKIQLEEEALQKQTNEYTSAADKLLTGYVQKLPALTTHRNTLLEQQNKVQITSRLQADITQISKEILDKDTLLAKLDAEVEEKKRLFDEAYNRQLDNLTELLAKSLKDGAPCPVCGSVEHPQIHIPSALPAESGVKQRKAQWEEAQSRRTHLTEERNALIASLESKKLSLEQNRLPAENSFSEGTLTQAENDLAKAQRAEAKLNQLNQALEVLKERLHTTQATKTALEKEQFTLQAAALEAKSRADHLNASLRADIPDLETLNRKIQSVNTQIQQSKTRLTQLTEERNNAIRQLAALEAETARAQLEMEKAQTARAAAHSTFQQALAEKGFQNEDDFLSAQLSAEEIDALSQKLNEYRSRRFAVQQRLESLLSQTEEQEKPDTAKLQLEYGEQEKAHRLKSEALAVAQNEFQRREKIASDYSSRYTKYQTDLEEAGRFREFAELLQGSRGISFTRYVLGVMLSLITAEANRLLRDVHGGRFQLYRKTDSTDRSRKTGLELEVQSAMAVSRFSTKNLSGGEKFLISLALSMALSAVLQSQSGGISIDAMFIDEGFGSLDPQSLQEAMGILFSIQGSRRTIGIISHVQELKELIPGRIDVSKDLNGSSLKIIV